MRAAVLMCLLVVAFQSFAQNEVSGVHGLVLRPDGKPIEGAFVLIRDYQQLNQGFVSDRWESRTGADGSFSFAAPNGCYDIFVSGKYAYIVEGVGTTKAFEIFDISRIRAANPQHAP